MPTDNLFVGYFGVSSKVDYTKQTVRLMFKGFAMKFSYVLTRQQGIPSNDNIENPRKAYSPTASLAATKT